MKKIVVALSLAFALIVGIVPLTANADDRFDIPGTVEVDTNLDTDFEDVYVSNSEGSKYLLKTLYEEVDVYDSLDYWGDMIDEGYTKCYSWHMPLWDSGEQPADFEGDKNEAKNSSVLVTIKVPEGLKGSTAKVYYYYFDKEKGEYIDGFTSENITYNGDGTITIEIGYDVTYDPATGEMYPELLLSDISIEFQEGSDDDDDDDSEETKEVQPDIEPEQSIEPIKAPKTDDAMPYAAATLILAGTGAASVILYRKRRN